jgi:hypothetical protein
MISLYLQWGIEPQYSIKNELICVLIIWSFFSNCATGFGVIGLNPFRIDEWDQETGKLSIYQQRWVFYMFYTFRSFFCIISTSIKPLYDSYHFDQIVLMPPSEENIKNLELALHQREAVMYFYRFLESNEKGSIKKLNWYRLLSLYMDIRCYE